MLVLKRETDQVLIIDKKIRVMVVEAHKDWAKIGIDAPRKMSIEREEIISDTYVSTEADAQLNCLRVIAFTCREEINKQIAKKEVGLLSILCNYLDKEIKLHNL